MTTKARYENGILTFFDSQTHERVLPAAPLVFYDDFLGVEFLGTESGSKGIWSTVEVALNTAIGKDTDGANGVISIAMDADSNAEDGVLYMGDQREFNVAAGLIFETRVNFDVLPSTSVARMVIGMCGDHNLAKDSATEAAWFRLEGAANTALLAESDDTTNNNDDKAAGTIAVDTWYTLRIDFSTLTDVRFYVDGVHVATGTTFDMSNLTAAEAIMQPYFSVEKDSGTGVGELLIDYVRIWSKRS